MMIFWIETQATKNDLALTIDPPAHEAGSMAGARPPRYHPASPFPSRETDSVSYRPVTPVRITGTNPCLLLRPTPFRKQGSKASSTRRWCHPSSQGATLCEPALPSTAPFHCHPHRILLV